MHYLGDLFSTQIIFADFGQLVFQFCLHGSQGFPVPLASTSVAELDAREGDPERTVGEGVARSSGGLRRRFCRLLERDACRRGERPRRGTEPRQRCARRSRGGFRGTVRPLGTRELRRRVLNGNRSGKTRR